MPTPLIFQDLFYVWLVGLIGGLIAYLAKQPLLLGYMLGGLLISPFTPGPAIQHPETVQHLADFGVVLLMFSLGLELAPVGLRRVGRVSLAIGTLLPLLVTGLWVAVGRRVLGWPLAQSVVVGCALSISSTMVITKMLMERGELKAAYGEALLGIAIIEDCLIMGLLLFLPMMADPSQRQLASVVWVSVKTVALLALIFTLGLRVVPRLLTLVGRTRDPELSILVLLALAMGIGVLGVWSGLSLELGAFVAGLVLSGSETTSQTMGRMLPMRDLFVVTFFVSLGVLLNPSVVASHWLLLAGLLSIVLGFKMVVATGLCLAFRSRWDVAWRVGVGLSQIGEFSIVLCTVAKPLGLIPADFYHVVVAASLLSILINTFVFNLLEKAPSMLSSMRHHG
ncbi:MAG: cation:proton antiporter [Candidatus Omnitrophica bacterium]|nr:cation:proton antiporter [Candidatus Omnitrophota bacterium]